MFVWFPTLRMDTGDTVPAIFSVQALDTESEVKRFVYVFEAKVIYETKMKMPI